MTTMMPLRDLELNTRESHLRAVARHFGLKIHPDGMHGLVVEMGVYRCEDHWHIGNLVRALTPLPAKPRKRNSHIGSAKRRNRRRVA